MFFWAAECVMVMRYHGYGKFNCLNRIRFVWFRHVILGLLRRAMSEIFLNTAL